MIDFPAWGPPPSGFEHRPFHAHNRLIASATLDVPSRQRVAAAIAGCLAKARGPTCLLLPLHGLHAWDRQGEALHDPVGLTAFLDAMRQLVHPRTRMLEIDAHINDNAFVDAALDVFDAWVGRGLVLPGGVRPNFDSGPAA
jgi:uncharacterized protein (UPF0261 family)